MRYQLRRSPSEGGGYQLEELRDPSPDFVASVLAIVAMIPPGRVMAYGDIAAKLVSHEDLVGTTGTYGARLVGQVMSRFGADVAWWRVIRSSGHPPKFHEQRALPHYVEERTPLTGPAENYRVDIKIGRFDPDKDPEPTQASIFDL
jgi:alkylated DNA nucleotide flippase Atl1